MTAALVWGMCLGVFMSTIVAALCVWWVVNKYPDPHAATNASCASCRHFVVNYQPFEDYATKEWGKEGRCRYNPPYHNGWPLTREKYRCNKWEAGAIEKAINE